VRYAAQQRLRDKVTALLPSVTVNSAYDGPGGYVLIISSPQLGRLTIRSEAEWRRLAPRLRRQTD
jgi:hypothetical protein